MASINKIKVGSTTYDVAGCKFSTNEQLVGEWTDGSKIYQKTISTTTPSATGTETFVSTGATIGTVVSINAIAYISTSNRWVSVDGTNVTASKGVAIRTTVLDSNASSNPNTLGVTVFESAWTGLPLYVTIRYTK